MLKKWKPAKWGRPKGEAQVGLLIRVGIDTQTGGCVAPLFSDGTFEYIPIPHSPEHCPTSEKQTYTDIMGRSSRYLAEFTPPKYRNHHPHNDPEFTTFTYGDPAKEKAQKMSQLEKGDLLIFYAGLRKMAETEKGKIRTYFIAYFTVEKVYDFRGKTKTVKESYFSDVPNNAHSKLDRGCDEHNSLVIVKGKENTKESKLLSKALPLGDDKGWVLKDIISILGWNEYILRSRGFWIDEEHCWTVKEYLLKDNS
ncbi:MAG: hypothetical protein WED07_01305 [Candidatus Freyarchaeum deiterrae]